jgi:hypothetical protein
VIEEQVDGKFPVRHFNWVLSTNERKAFAKLYQKTCDVVDQSFLQIPFFILFGQGQEVK